MTQNRRFLRIVHEFEVEVTDPITARTFTWDTTSDVEGDPAMASEESDEKAIVLAIQMHLGPALQDTAHAGFKWMGGSMWARPVVDGEHPPLTLPAMTVRRDDGTYPD